MESVPSMRFCICKHIHRYIDIYLYIYLYICIYRCICLYINTRVYISCICIVFVFVFCIRFRTAFWHFVILGICHPPSGPNHRTIGRRHFLGGGVRARQVLTMFSSCLFHPRLALGSTEVPSAVCRPAQDSSRFVKFARLQFNTKGYLSGCQVHRPLSPAAAAPSFLSLGGFLRLSSTWQESHPVLLTLPFPVGICKCGCVPSCVAARVYFDVCIFVCLHIST